MAPPPYLPSPTPHPPLSLGPPRLPVCHGVVMYNSRMTLLCGGAASYMSSTKQLRMQPCKQLPICTDTQVVMQLPKTSRGTAKKY